MFPTLHWSSTICKDDVLTSKIYIGYNINYVQKKKKKHGANKVSDEIF